MRLKPKPFLTCVASNSWPETRSRLIIMLISHYFLPWFIFIFSPRQLCIFFISYNFHNLSLWYSFSSKELGSPCPENGSNEKRCFTSFLPYQCSGPSAAFYPFSFQLLSTYYFKLYFWQETPSPLCFSRALLLQTAFFLPSLHHPFFPLHWIIYISIE